jgi:hypothetical protein
MPRSLPLDDPLHLAVGAVDDFGGDQLGRVCNAGSVRQIIMLQC